VCVCAGGVGGVRNEKFFLCCDFYCFMKVFCAEMAWKRVNLDEISLK
jgi:hypothetical protein